MISIYTNRSEAVAILRGPLRSLQKYFKEEATTWKDIQTKEHQLLECNETVVGVCRKVLQHSEKDKIDVDQVLLVVSVMPPTIEATHRLCRIASV